MRIQPFITTSVLLYNIATYMAYMLCGNLDLNVLTDASSFLNSIQNVATA